MGDAAVGRLAVVRENGVGEVVVLVDQHVQRDAVVTGVGEQFVQYAGNEVRRQDAFQRRRGEQIRIALQRVPDLQPAVLLEVAFEHLQSVVEGGEIEAQHDVAIPLVRRLPGDVGAAEHGVEGVAAGPVVVVLQQGYPAGLAEPPGTDQHGETHAFQPPQEAGLVDVERAGQPDPLEVGIAVGDGGGRRRPSMRPRAGERPNGK